MGIWKAIGLLLGANLLTGGDLLDGRKGGIGCGWVVIFIIIFFPFWIIYKILKLIFGRNK